MQEQAAAQDAAADLDVQAGDSSASPVEASDNASEQLGLSNASESAAGQEQLSALEQHATAVTASASFSQSAEAELGTRAGIQGSDDQADLQHTTQDAGSSETATTGVPTAPVALSPAAESTEPDGLPEKPSSPEAAAGLAEDVAAGSQDAASTKTANNVSTDAIVDAATVASSAAAVDAQAVPKPETPLPGFANATFTVPTEKWQHQQSVPLATTAAEIKHSLCSNWNIAETALSVRFDGQELQDSQSLSSCGIQVRLLQTKQNYELFKSQPRLRMRWQRSMVLIIECAPGRQVLMSRLSW